MADEASLSSHPESVDASTSKLQEKADCLSKQIETAIAHTKENKRKNQRRASYIKIATVLLSGIATVLLGLQIQGYEAAFRSYAFILGALVTVLTALEPFFNFRALWVEHEAALADFHRLKDKFVFYLVGAEPDRLDEKRLEQLHQEYQQIWNRLNRTWIEYRRSEGELA